MPASSGCGLNTPCTPGSGLWIAVPTAVSRPFLSGTRSQVRVTNPPATTNRPSGSGLTPTNVTGSGYGSCHSTFLVPRSHSRATPADFAAASAFFADPAGTGSLNDRVHPVRSIFPSGVNVRSFTLPSWCNGPPGGSRPATSQSQTSPLAIPVAIVRRSGLRAATKA